MALPLVSVLDLFHALGTLSMWAIHHCGCLVDHDLGCSYGIDLSNGGHAWMLWSSHGTCYEPCRGAQVDVSV